MTSQIQLLAQSQPWCPAAPGTTHGHAPCPQSFSNHLAHQEHKGKPKDTLKLGYVSLDGLTHNPQTWQVPSQLLLLRGSTDHCVSKPLGSLPHFNTNSLFGPGHVN